MKMRVSDYLSSMWIVLRKPRSITITALVAGSVVVVAAWLPNLALVQSSITSDSMSLTSKIKLLIALSGAIKTNYDAGMQAVIIMSGILAGIQLSLVSYYLKQKVKMGKMAGAGVLGVMTSLLGVGCASCGSILLTSILGVGTSAVVLAYLPWHGVELAIIGLLIIIGSVISTTKKLYESQFCEVK